MSMEGKFGMVEEVRNIKANLARRGFAGVAGIAALAGTVLLMSCDSKPSLKTDDEKAGYAVGRQMGESMKARGVKVDAKAFSAGLSEAMEGKPSQMSEQDLEASRKKLHEAVAKNMQAEMEKKREENSKSGEANQKKSAAYLEQNKKRAGVKVTSSGLQYEVIKEGKGKKPKATDTVVVHYVGRLIREEKDGDKVKFVEVDPPFDSSRDRGQEAEFPLNQVIPGWTEGLQLMTENSRYKFHIPSDLAYGPDGNSRIGPNEVLVFDVELFKVR